jgi:hypothetical protein
MFLLNNSNAMIETRVQHKQNIMKSGVSRTMLRLALHEDKRVRRCAAIAIGGLSLGDFYPCKIKHSFVELGAIPPLVDMMRTTQPGDEETLRCSLLALNSLILGETLFPKTVFRCSLCCWFPIKLKQFIQFIQIAMHEYAIEPLLKIAAGESTQDIESIKQAVFSIGCLSESEEVLATQQFIFFLSQFLAIYFSGSSSISTVRCCEGCVWTLFGNIQIFAWRWTSSCGTSHYSQKKCCLFHRQFESKY